MAKKGAWKCYAVYKIFILLYTQAHIFANTNRQKQAMSEELCVKQSQGFYKIQNKSKTEMDVFVALTHKKKPTQLGKYRKCLKEAYNAWKLMAVGCC